MDLAFLESQLKERWYLSIPWNFKFDMRMEPEIHFIYKNTDFGEILKQAAALPAPFEQYAINRWYNFWSNKALVYIFSQHPSVQTKKNIYNEIDSISFNSIDFRVGGYVYPNQFARTLRYALLHKEELLYWLYRRMRKNHRRDIKNEIFVIFYQRNGEHWRLKAELGLIEKVVFNFLNEFDVHRVLRLHLNENKTSYAEIVWCMKQE